MYEYATGSYILVNQRHDEFLVGLQYIIYSSSKAIAL